MALKPLKWYKSLATKKGRLAAGAFLAEGPRAIAQIMQQQPEAILEILTLDAPPLAYRTYPLRYLTPSQLQALCSTRTPQGLLAVVRLPDALYTDALPAQVGPRVLLLEDVQDPGNVGTLIRTAAAFDFSGVILTTKCADPLAPKCVQSTAGTVLSVWLRRTSAYLTLVEALQASGYACVAADLQGPDNPSMLASQPRLLLMLGNEAAGLSPALLHLAKTRVKIPLSPKAESLNVAVCGAICMYLSALVPSPLRECLKSP
jgi:TrmH family RNA methyltransferase